MLTNEFLLAECPDFWPVWLHFQAAGRDGPDPAARVREAFAALPSPEDCPDIVYAARQGALTELRVLGTPTPLATAAARGDAELVRVFVDEFPRGEVPEIHEIGTGAVRNYISEAVGAAARLDSPDIARLLCQFCLEVTGRRPVVQKVSRELAAGNGGSLEALLEAGDIALSERARCRVVCLAGRRSLVAAAAAESAISSLGFLSLTTFVRGECPLAAAACGDCPAGNFDAYLCGMSPAVEDAMFAGLDHPRRGRWSEIAPVLRQAFATWQNPDFDLSVAAVSRLERIFHRLAGVLAAGIAIHGDVVDSDSDSSDDVGADDFSDSD